MTDWSKLKVVELKKELTARGLPQNGLKQDLVNRLTADDETKLAAESSQSLGMDVPGGTASQNESAPDEKDSGAKEEEKIIDSEPAARDPGLNEVNEEKALVEDHSALEPNVEGPNASSEGLEGSTLVSMSEEEKQQPQPPAADEVSGKDGVPPPTSEPMATQTPERPTQSERGDEPEKPTLIEVVTDSQKRKRRSLTPDIPSDDASQKRMRHEEPTVPDVANDFEPVKDEVTTTQSDAEWVEKHNGVDVSDADVEPIEAAVPMEGVETGETVVDIAKEEVEVEQVDAPANEPTQNTNGETQNSNEEIQDVNEETEHMNADADNSRPKDGRFKDLFPASDTNMDKTTVEEDTMEGIETDRTVSPAIHPATTALYIRDFMRPINSNGLKEYLAFLATPPSSNTDLSIITEFYLDPIRSHAYVSFANISAASRVRSAIHDTVWPEETNRKPLWADFIPAEKLEEWIDQEKSTSLGNRGTKKKWEVAYEEDRDGNVIAVLRESNPLNVPALQNSMAGGIGKGIPSAPRGSMAGVPLGPRSNIPQDPNPYHNRNTDMNRRPSSNFLPTGPSRLDSGFKTTTAEPQLYYQPVNKELAKARLDNMDRITRADYKRDEKVTEINRYTFEGGDRLVDRGPEFFDGIRHDRPPRGPPFKSRAYSGRGQESGYRGGGRNRRGGGETDRYSRGDRYGGGYSRPMDDGYKGTGTRRY